MMEFSNSTSAKYTELIKKFDPNGAKKINDRYNALLKRLNSWIIDRGFKDKIKVDRILLQHAVLDYYSDISRLKEYHNIETTNSVKVISYEAYWLWRRRPLQIVSNPYEEDMEIPVNDTFIFCNEYFILSEISLYLYKKIDDNSCSKAFENDLSSNSSFIKSFLYHLKFRQCNAQAFELMLWGFFAAKEITDIEHDKSLPSDSE